MKFYSSPKNLEQDSIRGIIIAVSLLIIVMFIGIVGYIVIEDYPFVSAIYMTVITIATVGFKEVTPLSQTGMIFTILLIIFSFGIFAYVITNFTRYIVNGIFTNYFKDNKVKKQIKALENHVIVVGYGRNGRQTIDELLTHGEEVVLIEKNEKLINDVRRGKSNLLYVHGDATEDEVLHQAGIDRAKALITALPIDADNLFVVLSAREINKGLKIISRASNDNSDIKLKRAGATNVIMPARTGGQRMAKLVAQPDIVEFMDYVLLQSVNDVSIEEVSCQELMCGYDKKSIRELDIRNESGANIIGVRRKDGSYIINPAPGLSLNCEDRIFVIGTRSQIDTVKQILKS